MKRKKSEEIEAAAVPDVPVVFLDDEPEFVVDAPAARGKSRAFVLSTGSVAAAAAAVVLVAAIAPHTSAPRTTKKNNVVAALGATTAAGSFDVSYKLEETPGSTPETTVPECWINVPAQTGTTSDSPPCPVPVPACNGGELCVHSDPPIPAPCIYNTGATPTTADIHLVPACEILTPACSDSCPVREVAPSEKIACPIAAGDAPVTTALTNLEPDVVQGCGPIEIHPGPAPCYGCSPSPEPSPYVGPSIGGTGTIQVDPLHMTTTTLLNGEEIVVSTDDTSVTEAIAGQPDTKYALSDFTKLVIDSLGVREGSVAMDSLSSPTGYLDLTEQEAAGSTAVGTDTVDGVKVSLYKVTLTPDQTANPPGASPEELKTIADAHKQLAAEGYTNTTMTIGIGDDGLIHEITSITNFEDGGKVTLTGKFSNFGNPVGPTTTTTQPTVGETDPSTGAPETTVPSTVIISPPPIPAPTTTTTDAVTTTT
jgi:hypothetical protein